jgi:hypothetical protein
MAETARWRPTTVLPTIAIVVLRRMVPNILVWDETSENLHLLFQRLTEEAFRVAHCLIGQLLLYALLSVSDQQRRPDRVFRLT